MRLNPAILLAILAGLAMVLGCEPPATIQPDRLAEVWVASEMTPLTERTDRPARCPILAGDGQTVQLAAAANETISFQIVIDAPTGQNRIRLTAESLSTDSGQSIPADALSLFRMLPVTVTAYPAWYLRLVDDQPEPTSFYDAMIPVDAPTGGQPYTLQPDQRLAIWVDVAIPRWARKGTYRGQITIRSGRRTDSIPLEVEVYDIVLPDARPLAAVGGYDHRTLYRRFITREGEPYEPIHLDVQNPFIQRGLPLIAQLMRLGHDHRLDLFDRQIRPKINRDAHGRLSLNWDDYDAVVKPFLSGEAFEDRIGCPAWPIPFTLDWPIPRYYGGLDSVTYAATAADIITRCGRHFRGMNAGEQMFAWPVRGPVAQNRYPLFARLSEIIHNADRGIAVLSQLPTTPPELTGWTVPVGFGAMVDILAPPAQWLNPADARRRTTPKNPLEGVWLSPGQPPYLPSLSVLATPADVRAIAWFAMKYGCTGLFLPSVLNWSGDVFETPAGAETRLFYPADRAGLDGVLPSVRLKRLRRGLQDITLLWILRQRQRGALADALINAMVRYAGLDAVGDHYQDPRIGGWVGDGALWIDAHRMLLDEVDAAIHPSPLTPAEQTAERVRWNRFVERTSNVVIERVQTVMGVGPMDPAELPDTDQQAPTLRATIFVELYNQYDRTVAASLNVAELPPGWRAIVEEYDIPAFAPAERRRAKLVIEGNRLPALRNGKLPVILELDVEKQTPRRLLTEVAFLVAGRFNTPPVIDGQLDDWPLRPNFAAGDFRLLGRRGRHRGGEDPAEGLADQQTNAFVMYDDKAIYIAFNCEELEPESLMARPTNTIHYEQLLASGEDLVEVLLDPGRVAMDAENLYHLVVKPNGVLVEELGIATDPPLGRSEPAALGTTVATGRREGGWVVEMRIPRDAFGPRGSATFWGANFTRYRPRHMEASSWTGAERYFYTPRNLGTLYVPPSPTTTQPDTKGDTSRGQ
jgi:hypothetical protein